MQDRTFQTDISLIDLAVSALSDGAAAAKRSIALLDRLHANMFRTPADIALIPFSPSLKCAVGIAVDEEKADDPIIQELIETLSH